MANESGEWIMRGMRWDPYRIRSWKELVNWIQEIGFLPFFANDIPGFCLHFSLLSAGGFFICLTPSFSTTRGIKNVEPGILTDCVSRDINSIHNTKINISLCTHSLKKDNNNRRPFSFWKGRFLYTQILMTL